MVEYLIFLAISTASFALFALGLNLQWGFTGLINFGHVAFMTLGAYTTVLLSLKGVPLLISAVIGAMVAALLGLIIGFATLRLREDYLAIVTIGTGELIRLVVNNQELPVGNSWVSGAFGVQSYPIPWDTQPSLFLRLVMIGVLTLVVVVTFLTLWRWIRTTQVSRTTDLGQRMTSKQELTSRLVVGILLAILAAAIYISGVIGLYNYNPKAGLMFVLLLVLALVFWRLEILVRSPWGRILKAIREDEEIPKALGKNVFWYKLQSLMLGGAIAGIAGAFFAWQLGAIYPDNFQPQLTFDTWIMVILGGSGNNIGTILGAVIFFAYDAITREVLPRIVPLDEARLGAFRIMVIGLILMVLMIWRPQGILGKKEELTLGK
ncbi:branched-chain amino acid ABC transporter [Nostoc linckia z18]|uniref:Branched-chain amino acid ABC transporter n=2 Tax=Nostoc linckia TaxID=92942 RepID=A0A9Q5ZGS2_NOSLI|nr:MULTISPECIES: branched-chain amino acid ABC transporter permease [Nostoc]PHK30874.1 branched-chain amino acid ABC transporter [Nostoc linckia z15]PHK48238.1 branched-chain amino acid ABC transporter [Nostoc linckia z16]MBC1237884.1 branched-chain amino acid ABC transporter permease [Nostoc sp. 2RC]PHJ68327.1 branched-chain amino acid ABC transporter [Nostoc linckia z1]PHJ73763.1 branched-chain amino acid ABC transporter [Nostoc linckia z3]